jgi:hypothetical protein
LYQEQSGNPGGCTFARYKWSRRLRNYLARKRVRILGGKGIY